MAEMDVFTLETDYSCETGYPFDNSRQTEVIRLNLKMEWILNEQFTWLYPSILTDSLKMDYHFQIHCVQPPPPQRKKSEKECLWGRGRLYTAFRAANAFRVRVRASFFSQIRHRNALTEIAWGDAIQGLGIAMSTIEKNRKLLFISNVFYKQLHICLLFH